MGRQFAYFLLIMTALLAVSAAADDELYIIRLDHRQAESVIPMLREMYAGKATINGQGTRLFVRAPAPIKKEIEQLVGAVDVKPRMLRITVRGGGQGFASQRQLGVGGGVRTSQKPLAYGVTGQANESVSRGQSTGERTMMVVEGEPVDLGDGAHTRVVAHVVDGQAQLQLVASDQSPTGPSSTSNNAINTSVAGGVGQWIGVAGTNGTQQSGATGASGQVGLGGAAGGLSGTTTGGANSTNVSVRVDVMPR